MAELIQQPYQEFWDKPGLLTRREIQKAFNKLAENQAELMGMCDTAALLINFILEVKFGLKDRQELDVYVEAKKLQLAEARAKMKAEAEAAEKASSSLVAP